MTMKMIAIVGLVFPAASVAALVHEYRMDVLHGPYIQDRAERCESVPLQRLLRPIRAAADRLGWMVRPVVYLATIIAC